MMPDTSLQRFFYYQKFGFLIQFFPLLIISSKIQNKGDLVKQETPEGAMFKPTTSDLNSFKVSCDSENGKIRLLE